MSTRKPAAQRRQEIANAALAIIGEEGISALRTNRLAEVVGVTSGALFRHFPSMADILREVVSVAVAAIDETFPDPRLPPLARLTALAQARIRVIGPNAGLSWLLRSQQAHLVLPADAVAQLQDLIQRSRQTIRAALADGMADGSIRSDIAIDALMVPVLATIHALIGRAGVSRPEHALTATNDEVLRALEILLAPAPPTSRRDR